MGSELKTSKIFAESQSPFPPHHSMSHPGPCLSVDPDTGKCCPCRQYREADPQGPPPVLCLECLHGRSVHDSTNTAQASRPSVDSILKRLIGPMGPSAKVAIDAAKKETNDGLQKQAGPGSSSKGKGKASRTTRATERTESEAMHVGDQEKGPGSRCAFRGVCYGCKHVWCGA
jgi:hypothetical protein